MIKSLQLKRFQAHDDVTLAFKPGVNMIVGESDKGKTAVLRALRWVIFNRPSGFAFRSQWAQKGEETSVKVVLTNGEVTRARDDKKNVYSIGVFDDALEAVRTDVPEEVQKILGMTDLNLQRQGDKPFLLDEPAPEVARVLNRVAGLDGIDTAHSKITAKLRENQSTKKDTDRQLEEVTAQLEAYKDLSELEGTIQAIEKETGTIRNEVLKIQTLGGYVQSIEVLESHLKKTEKLPLLRKLGVEVTSLLAEYEELNKRGVLLTETTRTIEAIRFRLSAIDSDRMDPIQKELESITTTVEAEARLNSLFVIGKEIATLQASIKGNADEEQVLQDKLSTMNVCPECGADKKHWRK